MNERIKIKNQISTNDYFPPTPYPTLKFIDHQGELIEPSQPSIASMAGNFGASIGNWIKGGLKTSSDEVVNSRLEICKGCEFWDSAGFNGSGRCRKCGCSTWAKLRMATEKCPLDKWGATLKSI